MSLITPPATLPIRRIQWTLRQPHQVNRSGWTGRRQVLTTPGGALWSCSGEFKTIKGQANAKPWIGFFQSLEGQLHKFPVVAVEQAQHSGAYEAVQIIIGLAGSKTILTSTALPPLKMGDRISVLLVDGTWQLLTLTSSVAGTAAEFVPALRNNVQTGVDNIETRFPFAHVSLTGDSWNYSVDPGQIYSFSFDAEESF